VGGAGGPPAGDTYPLPGEKLPEVLSSDAPLKTAPQGAVFAPLNFKCVQEPRHVFVFRTFLIIDLEI